MKHDEGEESNVSVGGERLDGFISCWLVCAPRLTCDDEDDVGSGESGLADDGRGELLRGGVRELDLLSLLLT